MSSNMTKKTKSLTNSAIMGVAALLIFAATPARADDVAVKIGNFTFGPQELKVNDSDLDERRRYPAYRSLAEQLQIKAAR
jgi:hypothetical protein